MLQVLYGADPAKSANCVSPAFWKRTASVVCDAVTRMFKFIVKKCSWPTAWKLARIPPPHKRNSVYLAANYRPLFLLPNISVYFEGSLDDQFDARISKFIPESQFGFVRKSGTDTCGIIEHVNSKGADCRRSEGILISLDVAGAFGRCWWQRLDIRLKKKCMSGRALRFLYDHLSNRFIH